MMPKEKSDVGNETKADMKDALKGNPMDKAVISGGKRGHKEASGLVGDTSVRGAVAELHAQHPHKHDDHGPHHEGREHMRHEPLHGLKGR